MTLFVLIVLYAVNQRHGRLVFDYNGGICEVTPDDYVRIVEENVALAGEISEMESLYSEAEAELEAAEDKKLEYASQIRRLEDRDTEADDVALSETTQETNPETVSLGEACVPYENPWLMYYGTDDITCKGIVYKGCIRFNSNGESKKVVMYNLENRYARLTFTLGRHDNSGMDDCVINFYLDGISAGSIRMNANADNVTKTVYLNNCLVLEIEYSTGNTEYAFINAVVE
jgi:hypothetical protein